MQQNAVNGFHADDYTLNDNATASLAGGTVHASLEGGSVANASTKYSANDLATVHETRSRASSSRHRPTSKTSQNGDMSRSGMISRDNSDTNSRFSRNSMRSAQSEANTARLGVPFTFFVRVVGEIHTIETVKKLLERTEEKRIDGVMDNFVIPEQHVFIRPVGEKFDNWEMMGSPSKARVNLAFVKNRDAELRDVAEMVASKLLRDLLGSTAVTECLTNTLMNFNPQSIGLVDNHAPVLKEAKLIDKSDALVGSNSNFMYGVYYNEVIPAKALTTQVICLLKNWGFESVEPRSDCLHANHPFHTMTPVKWISSEESVALIDQATFSLKLSDLRMFLATMKVTLTSSPVAYKDINAM